WICSAPMAAISVRGLRKSYGSLEAVRGVDIEIAEGEVFALLGPNGAGKTTTVEILEGHRRRDAGDVSVLGSDPARAGRAFRRRIGIVLQSTGINQYLTVGEIVEQYRGFYPNPRPLDEILTLVGLDEKRDARVRKLSGGQQRRLDVAIGLAGNPDLLFLDEPTTGFDPAARRGAWEMVKGLKELGKTILLTTHYMDEATALADRVAIITAGRIVAEGPPAELTGRDDRATIIRFRLPPKAPALPRALKAKATVSAAGFELRTDEPTTVLNELTTWAIAKGLTLDGLEVARPSLEDVYLELTREAEA
ncbi:MAG: ABC transporter ATP-binding protein, partial [Actinomycetota bacterium]